MSFAAAAFAALAFAALAPQAARADDGTCDTIPSLPNPFDIAFNPASGSCSGNGDCSAGVCMCKDGWTGRSDFINTEGEDCHVNELVITVLWAFLLVVCLVVFATNFGRVKLRWSQYKETLARKQEQGQKYGLLNNRGMATLIMCFGFVLPLMMITCVLKIARPEERLGITAGATIMFALVKVAFYIAVYFFQPALIASILRGSRATRGIVRATYAISAVLSVMGIVSGASPLITLVLSNGKDDLARIMFYVYFLGTFLQLVGLGVQAQWTKVKVVTALNMSYSMDKSQRTLDIKNALVAVERENVFQTLVQGTIFFLYAFMPFMSNAHDYFWPIGWLAYAILSGKAAKTTLSDKKYGTGTGTNTGTYDSKDGSKSDMDSKDMSYMRSHQPASTYVSVTGAPSGLPPAPPGTPRGGGVQATTAERFRQQVPSYADVGDSRGGSESDSDFV